ncbi:MAG TPA: CRISPR-associated helicase Cas3', partial [Tahibacter sp.]|nr:CRISPR-associated helicase Cas3' [Tahibacter sp.]
PHAYRIRYVCDLDAVVDHIVAAAEAGKAVVWIRNTVNEARDAYARLRERLPPSLREKLELFHARFALGDRTQIEQRVGDHFGVESTAEQRAGRVLVATQVIEQSLDVDFDEMVTDLAPVDLLIQRAGRLRRHRRDAFGNRLPNGPDGRGEAELVVYGPPFTDDVDADWVSAWSRGTAFVYDNHAYLWRTVRALGERLDLGAAPRTAIEAVYDARDDDYPKALQQSAFKAESNDIGDRQMAGFNTIRDNTAYENDGVAWPDDVTAPTRLGEPTIELVLARVRGDEIVPWSGDADEPWAMSVVRVRRAALRGRTALGQLENAAAQLESSIPALRWRTLLVLSESGECYEGKMTTADGSAVRLTYDPRTGLGALRPDNGGQA